MKSELIEAIRVRNPEIMALFVPPFDHPAHWISFIEEYFGTDAPVSSYSVTRILNYAAQWHSHRFRALYIACWICHPVEKGSYMIRLTPEQKAAAQASADQLTWRASSHLASTSRSARGGEDFQFISGYGELLVIVEGDFLFLKMEGHNAMSISHMSSWVTKIRTGEGEVANELLNRKAKEGRFGIQGRGAENYSHPYKALIMALGMSGKMVTFAQVIAALRQKFPTVSIPPGGGEQALRGYFDNLYRFAGMSNPLVLSREFLDILLDARKDIMGIISDLVADERRLGPGGLDNFGVNRIFREIRMTPEEIDGKLTRFVNALKAPNFEVVKQINPD